MNQYKKVRFTFGFISLLIFCPSAAQALDKGQHLNQTPPAAVRQLVMRAISLAEQDKPSAAIATLKTALSISPNYLQAHVEYLNIKADYLGRSDEAEAEYQFLIRRFPRNPVYLMALYLRTNGLDIDGPVYLERVVRLAPEWAWAHYAKALLIRRNDPESAIVELQLCIEKDNSALAAYQVLIELQEGQVHRIDDAVQTAERLAANTDIRPQLRLNELWRLRLLKSPKSEEAKRALMNELSRLESSKDVDTLLALRDAYLNLLKDSHRANLIEEKIVFFDPSWTSERGWVYRAMMRNLSEVPRSVVLVNRQIKLWSTVQETASATDRTETDRIAGLKKLLGERPNDSVRRKIYEEIFVLAVRSGNAGEVRKFGRRLHRIDPDDSVLLSQMAVVLADSRLHLVEALSFARKAKRLTAWFRPVRRPPNTSQKWIEFLFSEQKQREQFNRNRAAALDALGWTLTQMRRPQEAEPWLRQAIEIERSEKNLWHLAIALQMMSRNEEATGFETESWSFLASTLRRKFTNESAPDLDIQTLEGRVFKLSDLAGKVVLINFWATWCVPCVEEMPYLKKLYANYNDKGLQILAVSTDEDISKVRRFVADKRIPFLVAHSPTLREPLKVGPIPTSLFIDKQGNIRYRKTGFVEGEEREIEVIVMELLKDSGSGGPK